MIASRSSFLHQPGFVILVAGFRRWEQEPERMSDEKSSKPRTRRAYTGETISLPTNDPERPASQHQYQRRRQPDEPPQPPQPAEQRRYRNPPPSQRGAQPAQAAPRQRPQQPAALPHHHARQMPAAAPARQPAPHRQAQQHQAQPHQKAQKTERRSTWRRVRRTLLLLALVALALVLLGGGGLYWQAHAVAEEIVVPDVRSNPPLNSSLIGATNVLLIGVDERPDHPEEGVRSDTLILARIHSLGGWVNLLSIPRDTQVEIPGVGITKINVAYGQGYARAEELYGTGTTPQQGGMALAAQTVEQALNLNAHGMRIHHTAQVNFEGFVGIIDALGGITIDVPTYIIDYEYPTEDFGTTIVEFQPGPQQMDGQRALIYARTRHADSDFGRAERQQQVLRAIVAELQSRGWAGRVGALPALMGGIKGEDGSTPPVRTTMPFDRPDNLLALTMLAGGLDSDSIGRLQISPETVVLQQEIGTNLVWDPASLSALVSEWALPPDPPEEPEQAQQ
jgi:LCP family protein required for cell wall assembly